MLHDKDHNRFGIRGERMKPEADTRIVQIGEQRVNVTLRPSARARRIGLRIDPQPGTVTLTTPAHIDPQIAWEFMLENTGWIVERLGRRRPPVQFSHGAEIPYRGQPHVIESLPDARGLIACTDGVICVPGRPEHLARRLCDWLKAAARTTLTDAATMHAIAFSREPGRISIRDQKSRWGSCAASGNLSFSWRLILAPPEILDYVAAHEAAHLVEMNHSPAFWKLVHSRVDDPAAADKWLRDHGPDLHRYRADLA